MNSTRQVFDEASVHGRFQPFHNEHLEYLKLGKARCDFLWIGLAMFDIVTQTKAGDIDDHRTAKAANPFTYFERVKMITDSLAHEGVATTEFGFIPFPIDDVELLPQFLPVTIPCLTTICEPWNREKISRLEMAGYQVEVLLERKPKEISGARIRELIANQDEAWFSLVPAATVSVVNSRISAVGTLDEKEELGDFRVE